MNASRWLSRSVSVALVLVAARLCSAQALPPGYSPSVLAGATESRSRDGSLQSARFTAPRAVAVDGGGNVYVADTQSSTVRRITPSGSVSTLAGSPGDHGFADGTRSGARFAFPRGLAVDVNGNVYVADALNHSIRRISPSGVVRTLAGTGSPGSDDGRASSATFRFPSGVAVDANGVVYVADTGNHAIRVISTGGSVSTLAGVPGEMGFADGNEDSARFHAPEGIAVDAGGAVYVADTGNATLRVISAAGQVTTLAGSPGLPGLVDGTGGSARFANPASIAVGTDGRVYVGDGSAIRQVGVNGAVVTLAGRTDVAGLAGGAGTDARFSVRLGVAVGSGGDVYVADTYNQLVRRVGVSGAVEAFAGDPEESVWEGPVNEVRFAEPASTVSDAAGNVYVADRLTHTVRRISPNGRVTVLAGAPGQPGSRDASGANARFFLPVGLALAANGDLFVAEQGNHVIRRVTPGGTVTTFAGTAGSAGDNNGTGRSAEFYQPRGLAFDAAGNLYVADSWNHAVRRITPGATVSTLAGRSGSPGSTDGSGASARFTYPQDVAVSPDGTLSVADGAHVVRAVTPAGATSTLAGSAGRLGAVDGTGASARFYNPGAVQFSGGVVQVLDGSGWLRRINADGVVTSVALPPFTELRDLSVSASNLLYLADAGADRVWQATPDMTGIPVIRYQPAPQAVVAGGTVTFSVTASGASGYQWLRDGVVIEGATGPTLTLTGVQASQAGNYSVRVQGPSGSVESRAVALSVVARSSARLINLSTRARVEDGERVMIAGFVLTGGPRQVLVRAAGPALAGLAGMTVGAVLPDPFLTLHDGAGVLATNDNWGGDAAIQAAADLSGAYAWEAADSKDAALLLTLPPGGYTAVVDGKGGTGVSLVEVYEVDRDGGAPKLINLSTRSIVRTGEGVQIAGFVIGGSGPKRVVLRASGPALAERDITGTLADPVLELYSGTAPIAGNDNWTEAVRADFQRLGVDNWPAGSADAALAITLAPGDYTAVVTSKDGTPGVCLIEVYEVE